MNLLVNPSLFCNDWVDLCGNKEKVAEVIVRYSCPDFQSFFGTSIKRGVLIFVNVRAALHKDKEPRP